MTNRYKTITLINFLQSTVGTRHSAIVQNMNLAAGLGVGVGAGVGMGLAVADLPHLDRHGADYNKIYCQRPIIQHTDCLNTSVLDCSVTFMVDKNICLLGVQVRCPHLLCVLTSFLLSTSSGCSRYSHNKLHHPILFLRFCLKQ